MLSFRGGVVRTGGAHGHGLETFNNAGAFPVFLARIDVDVPAAAFHLSFFLEFAKVDAGQPNALHDGAGLLDVDGSERLSNGHGTDGRRGWRRVHDGAAILEAGHTGGVRATDSGWRGNHGLDAPPDSDVVGLDAPVRCLDGRTARLHAGIQRGVRAGHCAGRWTVGATPTDAPVWAGHLWCGVGDRHAVLAGVWVWWIWRIRIRVGWRVARLKAIGLGLPVTNAVIVSPCPVHLDATTVDGADIDDGRLWNGAVCIALRFGVMRARSGVSGRCLVPGTHAIDAVPLGYGGRRLAVGGAVGLAIVRA